MYIFVFYLHTELIHVGISKISHGAPNKDLQHTDSGMNTWICENILYLNSKGPWDSAQHSFWELKRSHVIDSHFSFFPKKFAPVDGYLCETKELKPEDRPQKQVLHFSASNFHPFFFERKKWWESWFVSPAFDEVSMLGGILITSISVAVITTSFTEHYQQRCRVHEAPRCERRNHREPAFSTVTWWVAKVVVPFFVLRYIWYLSNHIIFEFTSTGDSCFI